MDNPIIEPKNLPVWTAVGFALAVIALAMSFINMSHLDTLAVITQAEVMTLNKQVKGAKAPAAVAPAAPVAESSDKK